MMWLPQQQLMLTELVQKALIKLCVEHVPFESRLELDGLICISSDAGGMRQMVVKVHTAVGPKQTPAEDICPAKVVERNSVLPQRLVPNNNGLSRLNGINRHADPRSLNEDNIVVSSEEDFRSVLANTDSSSPAPYQHASQILKLLTEFPAARAQNVPPTDLSRTAPTSTCKEPLPEPVIKKEITVQDNLATEVGSGGGISKWRCKVCHKCMNNFTELEAHMRNVHVRFVCRLCLNSFTLSCNLRRHMKLHAGVRPHLCMHCPASFSRSTDLKIHMKKHPNASNPDKDASGPLSLSTKSNVLYECDLCNKGFATASHLAEHRNTHMAQQTGGDHTGDDSIGMDNTVSDGDPSADSEDATGGWNPHTDQPTSNDSDIVVIQPDDSDNITAGCIDLSDTMREFAPLFQVADNDGENGDMHHDGTPSLPGTVAESGKTSTPLRSNKRKGLPMKRVDAGNDDSEMSFDECNVSIQDGNSEVAADASTTDTASVKEENGEYNGSSLETKVFACQYAGGCSTSWYGFAAYERHYVSAHGGRYPCALCPQSFTSRNNRRRHADGHEGAAGRERHQCMTCGKRFARADIIKEHRLTHTRSYRNGTCSKCGETCSSKKSLLLLHLKRCLAYVDIDKDIDDTNEADQKPMELSTSEVRDF